MLVDERSRHALDVAEEFADGLVTSEERQAAEIHAQKALEEITDRFGSEDLEPVPQPCVACAAMNAVEENRGFGSILASTAAMNCREAMSDPILEARIQTNLLRDIFKNPALFVEFDPRWRTSDVVGLARAIYDDRAFERMPILADALMDAGCEHEEIIGHCRGAGPHVRGCWVVDLILGKE
jgi:hypothetical protein